MELILISSTQPPLFARACLHLFSFKRILIFFYKYWLWLTLPTSVGFPLAAGYHHLKGFAPLYSCNCFIIRYVKWTYILFIVSFNIFVRVVNNFLCLSLYLLQVNQITLNTLILFFCCNEVEKRKL